MSEFSDSEEMRGKSTIADYDAVADAYAEGNMSHDVSQNLNALLEQLSDRPTPLDVLDLGCAGGRPNFFLSY